ncbi:GspH/FimT family pseudopilin [Nodularia chucula]|uniref:GspH/FimT family pseudopilin n=1 Tax=Nodularia chucula TaxID=3093667 RepID=UPI0039C71C7D
MKVVRKLYPYWQNSKDDNSNLNDGFTLLEILSVIMMVGVLCAIAVPSWLGFMAVQRLNTAQNQVYRAIRQAQSEAKKQNLTVQASFREQNNIVQWAVHPGTVDPVDANWNDLDSNVCLYRSTLQELNGVRRIKFDYRGNVRQPPLGRVTLATGNNCDGGVKRCVIVSTIIGAMRTAKNDSCD